MRKLNEATLRKIIREAISDATPEFLGTIEEIEAEFAKMSPEEIATKDYIDSESGEIYLEVGQAVGESPLIKQKQNSYYNLHQDEYEDEQFEDETAQAQEELDGAIASFVADVKWDHDMTEDDMSEDAALDIADAFFHENPDWQRWCSILGISKQTVKMMVAEMIFG